MASLATFPSQFATRYVDLRATICEEFVAVHVGTGINADSQVPITNYLCVLHASVPSMAMGASFTKVQDGLNFHISAECSTKVHAPYMGTVPLPPLISTRVQPTADNTPAFYPIDILSSLSQAREIELERMTLICPVHIHTPGAHIGTIHGTHPGQKVNALDMFRFLETLARKPLDFHGTYFRLSQQMKAEIEAAFIFRNRQRWLSVKDWEIFASGQPITSGPIGEDLLLGNLKVWGVEKWMIGGYSVVHLA